MKYLGISAQNFSEQAVFTLHKTSQEQIKQRNRRKSDQEQMHDRLLQLKMICHCGYGFCQGFKFWNNFKYTSYNSGPVNACDELMSLETLLYG